MGTDNIQKLRFLKERLYQVAQTGNLHDILDGKKIARHETSKPSTNNSHRLLATGAAKPTMAKQIKPISFFSNQ